MLETIDECDVYHKGMDAEGIRCCICSTDKTSVRSGGLPR